MDKQLDFNDDLNKCSCGRSPTEYCIGYHELSDKEWAQKQEENPEIAKVLSGLNK